MDELTIDDKKYISTKRAAKITGYAKDYVGQLCREGRVPARLVGRSWYVLESALQDHRFGEENAQSGIAASAQGEEPVSALTDAWQSPRYEPVAAHELPTVNRLDATQESLNAPEELELSSPRLENPAPLRDAWEEWFRLQQKEPQNHVQEPFDAIEDDVQPYEPEKESENNEEEAIVPIRAIYHQALVPRAQEKNVATLLKNKVSAIDPAARSVKGQASRSIGAAIVFASVFLALAAASVAIIGSGYVDSYAVSIQPARIVAGISLYNK